MALENNIVNNQDKHKKHRKKVWFEPKNNKSKLALLLISVPILLLLLIIVESAQLFFPFNDLAAGNPRPVYIGGSQPIDIDAYLREYFANKIPKKTMQATVTAYSSTNGETDETPYHTAIGTAVRDGIVAANFLPIGTVVRFPDRFGEKLFIVEDRMNERFGLQVDIWMSNQEEAKNFGLQYLKMEIF